MGSKPQQGLLKGTLRPRSWHGLLDTPVHPVQQGLLVPRKTLLRWKVTVPLRQFHQRAFT